jgi:ribose-phosphate pyrophosphokinase
MRNPTPLKIISGNAHLSLSHAICDNIGLSLGEADVKTFPDGETCVKINDNVRGADVFVIQPTCYPANNHLMELLIMVDALKRASAQRITAVMPFYGYARQDRKDQPRVPITAKLIADLLTTAGINRLITMDLHAQQIQGFFNIPVDHLYASPIFFDYLNALKKIEDLIVISPDIGGMKMAAAYANLLALPLGFVAKRRINDTQVEACSLVGDVEGKTVLLVDDLTETAGTLLAAAQLVKDHGAKKVKAAVTHGMLGPLGKERLKQGWIDELITTNSTPIDTTDLPITCLSVAPLFAEAIQRIHSNQSVTSLFKIDR